MRVRCAFVLGLLVTMCVSVAEAAEVVHFSNGTYLKVLSHQLKGDMVQVSLDATSTIAFPLRMIDRIEGAVGVVWGRGANQVQANQAVPRPETAGESAQIANQPVIQTGGRGVRRTAADYGHRASLPGYSSVVLSGAGAEGAYEDGVILRPKRDPLPGSYARGDKLVLDGPGGRSKTPARLQMKSVVPQAPPPEPVEPE
jgi:hypothetical protein